MFWFLKVLSVAGHMYGTGMAAPIGLHAGKNSVAVAAYAPRSGQTAGTKHVTLILASRPCLAASKRIADERTITKHERSTTNTSYQQHCHAV